MSRIYWLSVFAAVGLAAASAHAQPVGGNDGSQPRAQQRQAQPAANTPPVIPPAIQDAIQRAASALEAANNKQPSADETAHAQEDLQAQKDMAFWAKLMFWAATAESLITLAGVFLVWKTLQATWAAKDEAKRAADAAYAAVKATKDATNSTIEAMAAATEMQNIATQRQLRAYLLVTTAHVQDLKLGRFVNGHVGVKNFGQTPAKDIQVTASIYFGVFPLKEDLPELVAPYSRAMLGPSDVMFSPPKSWPRLDADDIAAFDAKKKAIWIHGRIDYVDVFGKPRWVIFKLICGGTDRNISRRENDNALLLSACDDGNDFT